MKKSYVVLAVIAFLFVLAIFGIRWWRNYGTIQHGNLRLEAPLNIQNIPPETLINYVDARTLDLNIDAPSKKFISRALARIFLNTPHSKIFDQVSSEAWEVKWDAYKMALTEKARKNNLDIDSLNKCLE